MACGMAMNLCRVIESDNLFAPGYQALYATSISCGNRKAVDPSTNLTKYMCRSRLKTSRRITGRSWNLVRPAVSRIALRKRHCLP